MVQRAQRIMRRRAVLLLANSFELMIAVGALVAAVGFLIDHEALRASSVGTTAGPALTYAWCALYGVSGLLVLGGLWTPSDRVESAGLSLLAACAFVHAIATLASKGIPSLPPAATYAGVGMGALLRAYLLHRIRMAAYPAPFAAERAE